MPSETKTGLSFSSKALLAGIAAVVIAVLIDFLWGAQLGWYPPADSATPAPTTTAAASPLPSLIDDPRQPNDAVQDTWYCWDNPPVLPHHIGHHVAGDHLCTWGELRDSGFAGPP